ncbi:MAG: hypothetical protein J0I00_01750 [Burkholderiales bacterium]|nr:hypothetical protein [Burkholderiales bacterium]
MKKSFLSLSAAVALGSLGFAGSAHALGYIGAPATAPAATPALPGPAVGNVLNPGAVGNMLFTPYYTAQGSMATLINITNTDGVNGKAVKVRFRGAANSDDVLDFTLFLSPGDVWSASVSQNASGAAEISTTDKSCTIPDASAWPAQFSTLRLPAYQSGAQQNLNLNEGYIEILNMADVPPNYISGPNAGKANALYTNIKHVAGVAPCSGAGFAALLTPTTATGLEAEAAGLSAATGGLMGTWALANQENFSMFSGNHVAVVSANTLAGLNLVPVQGYTNIAFTPQVPSNLDLVAYPAVNVTADPLLQGGMITPLWFDLPDMSTPLLPGAPVAAGAPEVQALGLSGALSHTRVLNDYVANGAGAAVPMATDWVVSQPTRRYFASMNYAGSAATSAIVTNAVAGNPYAGILSRVLTANGPQACMLVGFGSTDREERVNVTGGSFSPGASSPTCGEVFVVQFGASSVLQAAVTTRTVTPVGTEGWAQLTLPGRLPVDGFAATSLVNNSTGVHYGWTLPHRYVD